MTASPLFPRQLTALLVYGRPPLVFGGLLCALAVMWTRNPYIYSLGVVFLFVSMCFDLVDGWFAERFKIHSSLAQLADRVMDKVVYSIVFPLVAVGLMWRLHYVTETPSHVQLLHAIFILVLCITVMVRDQLATFFRISVGDGPTDPEPKDYARLRTIVAAPVGALLYAYAFYIPTESGSSLSALLGWVGNLQLRTLFFIEIILLIINFGSIAGLCRKYGSDWLDELCDEDELLRRRILSLFPNALTVLNALMGLMSLFFAQQGRVREAYMFLMGATLFDKLDGAVARRLGLTTPLPGHETTKRVQLGGIMDDIADAISFCIVPALLFYYTLSAAPTPGLANLPLGILAGIYALAGIGRLVYFTLDRNPVPGFFKGLPTPAAALWVSIPMMLYGPALEAGSALAGFWGVIWVFFILLTALLMNLYPVRYVHFGRFLDHNPWASRLNTAAALIFLFTPWFPYYTLIFGAAFLLSPLYTRRISRKIEEELVTTSS
ncbi:MAG: CDP-alcohol phosphatidyltransferase family protein [Desulfobacterales bacterium]